MKIRSTVVSLALVATLAFTSQASAQVLDFGVIAPTTGSLTFAGGAAPLVGTNIEVDNVTGLGTPANSGLAGQRNCIGCVLNFTTGGHTGGWNFGPGGTITLTGGVDLNGNNVLDGGDIAAGTTLLSGSFTGTAMVTPIGSLFKIAGAAFIDTKDAALAAFYGLPGGPTVDYIGGFNISFNSTATPFGAINVNGSATNNTILSGDITNVPVDLPSSLLLLGSGLVGFAYLTARTRRS